jgi:hypothetical protein
LVLVSLHYTTYASEKILTHAQGHIACLNLALANTKEAENLNTGAGPNANQKTVLVPNQKTKKKKKKVTKSTFRDTVEVKVNKLGTKFNNDMPGCRHNWP